MFNALGIVNNPYQGSAKRVLCCCSAGLLRSPTAANVLHKEFGFNTRAVGIEESYALIPISEVLVNWAHEIVVMTEAHAASVVAFIEKMQHKPERIPRLLVLNIPDNFEYHSPILQRMITQAYTEVSEQAQPIPTNDDQL